MTDGSSVLCRRCGFANQGGDQFCGSCGAFLEWEGETSDGAAPESTTPGVAPTPPAATDEGLGGLVHPAGAAIPPPAAAWTPAATPATTPATTAPAATPGTAHSAPGADALLRCPACGIANAGTRTFCQSCGTRLPDTARVAEPTREQIAAAVAAPAKVRTTAVSGVSTGRPEPETEGSRGIAGWIVAMALLGIVVGVGIVAASALLRSPGPDSGATTQPTGIATAGPGDSPGASTDPGTSPIASGEPPTTAPTAEPEPAPLALTGAAASSVVGGLARFAADQAIDGSYKTCWQEGSKVEKGQWIEVAFGSARVDAVVINNGYGASAALYKGNHRLKVVQISVDGGEPMEVTLKDSTKSQRIELGGISGATRLRITIVSVYPAVKTAVAGTPFDDAALGEIGVIGVAGG